MKPALTDILKSDVTDGGSWDDAVVCTIKQRFFIVLICCVLKIFMFILYSSATQLILTEVQLEIFSISRGPVEFLICNDKNGTIITSTYK